MQQTTKNQNIEPISIISLETLSIRKRQVREKMDNKEQRIGTLWHNILKQPSEEELSSPTKRIMNTITSTSALIDGALLGWKLYRRFGGTVNLFRRKKKK